ncbi:MAG: hypothetical protein ACYTGX_13480 [Planctomycetota bacterium]|jgi:hypothetical protein
MARRSGRQEVTTEPVSDYDYDDAPSGGIDLATSLAIFTFLFILAGIIVTYMELKNKYDVGKEPGDPSIYKPYDERLGPDTAASYSGGGDEGGDEGGEEGGSEEGGGEEGGSEEGGSEEGGSGDSFDDE